MVMVFKHTHTHAWKNVSFFLLAVTPNLPPPPANKTSWKTCAKTSLILLSKINFRIINEILPRERKSESESYDFEFQE